MESNRQRAEPDGQIAIEAPPELPRATAANPLARLLPVAMVIAAAGMMVMYFRSGGIRSSAFMFFPVMMVVSLLGTVAYGARSGSQAADIEEGRRDYLRYLDGVDRAAADIAAAQQLSLRLRHPDPETLWALAGGPRMWERVPTDADYCHVRVGRGICPLATTLVAPALGPIDEIDPVPASRLRRLLSDRSLVQDVPVAVDLRSSAAVSLNGDPDCARGLLRAMVCELAVLHSPEQVRIAAVVAGPAEGEWDWLKWLPHHQHPHAEDGVGSARLTYHSLAEAERDFLAAASELSADVMVVLDGGAVTGAERLWGGGSAGITVLTVGTAGAPAGSHLRFFVGPTWLSGVGPEEHHICPDALSISSALVCALRLARHRPESRRSGAEPPGWPELMGVDDAARIDPALAWRTRSAGRHLRVPIGVSDDGSPVELDIKEAALGGMGPHGLCVGATGSGKSEFLRCLALGMITAHPPEALNLVLVDFKGGASFLGLERAPHVSAVITNLADEAHLVARMKDALSGELHRRQELFRAAGNVANIGEYEHIRRSRPGLGYLPALLVMVDEFSELLTQHPDFAELFLAIGRLGRSLGVHLLLASQRLEDGRLRGLESHLSYRICLKTFSANESRAVLGVADAFELPAVPGAAYLKTVSGELVRFRTAFVSGRTTPTRQPAADWRREPAVPQFFTATRVGSTRSRPSRAPTNAPPLLDTVVDRLAGHGIRAHQVWLPPLAESPPLDEVLRRRESTASLTVPVGLVDSPFEQRRDPLVVSLGGPAGNVAIVGGPQSGKSTAARTLVLALSATHTPTEVQFYCLDFGGGTLSSLRSLPHVGSVAGRNEVELVGRTVSELETIVRAREVTFREGGIDSMAEYRRRRAAGDRETAEDLGDVFLVVDGWASIRQEFDTLESSITMLAAQGLSCGVHVVVVASRWAEIRPALKDQIGTRIELRLGDPAESELDRKSAKRIADRPPGRGIVGDGREMVLALPRLDGLSSTAGLTEAISAAAAQLHVQYGGRRAAPVRLLPGRVPRTAIAARSPSATRIVLGIGQRELKPVTVDFAQQSNLVVFGEAECGKTATLRQLCSEIVRSQTAVSAQLMLVDYRRTLLGVVESDHLIGYAMSAAALTAQLPALSARLQTRLPGAEVTQYELRNRSWWTGPEIYVVVDDYDLVAGASGTPLAPLLDFLPHAKDLGLHLVVARRSGGAARAMFDPVLACIRDLGCAGLMMSAAPDDGVLLGTVRPVPLPPGRGTLVSRNQPQQLVQVAWTEPP